MGAPQAFDTDLHIAFSGGGVSRVILSDDLSEETSQSYSASINYDKPTDNWVAGFTVEGFYTDNEVQYIDEVEGIRDFIRTPETYGFANLSFTPSQRWNANINYVYTGSMIVPHFAGAPNQLVDEMFTSPSFNEVSTKIGYKLPLQSGTNVEFYGGVKNIFNSYQSTFDIGKNRDSNFVFGPAQPRTIFVGAKWFI